MDFDKDQIQKPMFFILGRGRSGTTLLMSMLNAHPDVFVPSESLLLLKIALAYRRKPITLRRWPKISADIWSEKERMKLWRITPESLDLAISKVLAKKSLSANQLIKLIYQQEASLHKSQIQLLGDKNPNHALFASMIFQIFPEAKFIHLIRDPYDNVHSYRQVPFDLQHAALLAYRWKYFNDQIRLLKKSIPDQFFTIKYEDLVSIPDRIMYDLLNFLNLSSYKYSFKKNFDHPLSHLAEIPFFHQELLKPIHNHQVGIGLRKLENRELFYVDLMICSKSSESDQVQDNDLIIICFIKFIFNLLGWVSVFLEKSILRLPKFFRKWLITLYRKSSELHFR